MLSEIFRIVNYFTIGDLSARSGLLTAREGAPTALLAALGGLGERKYLVQSIRPKGVVHPPPISLRAEQSCLSENTQMKGEPGLGDIERLFQLPNAPFAMGNHLDDVHACRIR